MSVVRSSVLDFTFRINCGAVGFYPGAVSPPPAQGEDFNWGLTLNINSVWPFAYNGLNDTDAFDPTKFDPNNLCYTESANGKTGTDAKDMVVNNTLWQEFVPKAMPATGLTYTQMIARDEAGNFINQPSAAPGLFENDDSLGYQYSEIGVLGAKLTMKFVPLPSQTDIRDDGAISDQTAVEGHNTEPAEFYAFLHTQSSQGAIDSLISRKSQWCSTGPNGEVPLANLPYIRSRVVSGNVSSQAKPDAYNYTTNKQGNAAVLQYKYGASTVHQCDVMDEDKFWTRTDQASGFANPAELDHISCGLVRHLSGPPRGRCAPSGYVQARLEQIICLRKPISTRTIHLAQQPPAQAAGGAAPGGGTSYLPASMLTSGGKIGTGAGALYVASLIAQ